ncbi:hypothetical protein F2Q69_00012195 [Brassica cretica]|uniref:YTH domain-containing family protein n=1 Tax=Brassica cretica TaxID=69181 RepID=A0A8S9QZ64_BRACR|nr:hypothetical protein F2Q69_00012195 [Brassica cretica]
MRRKDVTVVDLRDHFPETFAKARVFEIKLYDRYDVQNRIQYGNQKLNAAYYKDQENSKNVMCIFCSRSVNASGQFVGLAKVICSFDLSKSIGNKINGLVM